jgi:hypothetical protein
MCGVQGGISKYIFFNPGVCSFLSKAKDLPAYPCILRQIHVPRISSSSVIVARLKAKCRFYAATIPLFYIPQKHDLDKCSTVPVYALLPRCPNKSLE